MQTLDELKALLSPAKRHLLDKAHQLGLNELDAKLAAKPHPAGTSPAAMPPLQRSLLYSALLAKAQQMQIPCHRLDLAREEKHRIGVMQTQNDGNLSYLTGLLPKYLKISAAPDATVEHYIAMFSPAKQGEYRAKQAKEATAEYLDNFATLLWEGLDAILSSEDPVKSVALLRLMQEDGFEAVQLEADTSPELKAA